MLQQTGSSGNRVQDQLYVCFASHGVDCKPFIARQTLFKRSFKKKESPRVPLSPLPSSSEIAGKAHTANWQVSTGSGPRQPPLRRWLGGLSSPTYIDLKGLQTSCYAFIRDDKVDTAKLRIRGAE